MGKPQKRKVKSIKRNYWKKEEEVLLKQWADKAQCYQWMHNRSRDIYQRKNALYTIPVIIISTITGTANFAQERFSDKAKEYVVMIIGSMSIFAGILTTIYQFLKISEINEGHRAALLSWGKFHRNLESELTRHPLDRTSASELIKISKEEYNRLVEISPFISKGVMNEFNKKFKGNNDLTKPEIGNVINSTDIYTMNTKARQRMIDELNDNIINKNKSILKKEEKKDNQIEKFKNSFFSLNSRFPTKEEIMKNMKYINDDNYSSHSDINSVDSYDLEKGLKNENINLEIGYTEEESEISSDLVNEDSNEDNEEEEENEVEVEENEVEVEENEEEKENEEENEVEVEENEVEVEENEVEVEENEVEVEENEVEVEENEENNSTSSEDNNNIGNEVLL